MIVAVLSMIGAERDDRISRSEAAPQQPEDVQIAEPLTVGHVALPALDVLDVAGVDERHGEATRLKDLEDRHPVDAGGFHRHVRHATGGEPVSEAVKISGKSRKRSHGNRITVGRHGNKMFGGPAINAGRHSG
jgi:hypothetical protein